MANDLETRIRKTNLRYRKEKKALIQKLEVPIKMTSEGLIASYSTIDFYGIYSDGKGIAFDAKEHLSKTSFPLKNIKQHQYEYLKLWGSLGGEAFFLIHFKQIHPDSAFVAGIDFISTYWDNPDGRKSIPLSDFKQDWLTPIDDYLKYFYDRIIKSPTGP